MSLLADLYRGGWLRTVDHAFGESLRRLDPDTADAVLAAAALCQRAVAQGHSVLPLAQVGELLLDLVPEREPPALPPLDEWLALLRASRWCAPALVGAGMTATDLSPKRAVAVMPAPTGGDAAPKPVPLIARNTPLVLEGDALSLRRYWDYETRLAAAIRQRLATSPLPVATPAQARLTKLFPDATSAQADAARVLLAHKLLLLTGGPGTGKTTTVARAMVLFAESFRAASSLAAAGTGMTATARSVEAPVAVMPAPAGNGVAARSASANSPRIALAAPTGKAAARLAESVRDTLARLVTDGTLDAEAAAQLAPDAKTLHRLLGWRPDSTAFRHDATHPLPADLVIVDEASMIDLPLMCKLVEAVAPEATLLLIGDRDQLPSVETGDVLAALCDAAAPATTATAPSVGAGMTATMPPVGAGMTATGVSSEQAVAVMPAPTSMAPRLPRVHLTHSHRQRDDTDVATLAALIRDGDGDAAMAGLAEGAFRGVTWQHGGDRGLGDAVLAVALADFRRVAAAADVVSALTAAKQFRVLTAVREGPAGSRTLNALVAGALDPARRGEGFFHGRLVLITENSYRHGLFNGDIGIAWREDGDGATPARLRVWFDADGGPRAWLPAALPAHESAFALTVHKSQGSEFERVFLALPEHGARPVSRELLYTGLTRCRQSVTVWATEHTLRDGIARRAQRWSGLTARLTAARQWERS